MLENSPDFVVAWLGAREARRDPRRPQHALEGARGGRGAHADARRGWRSQTAAISTPCAPRASSSRCRCRTSARGPRRRTAASSGRRSRRPTRSASSSRRGRPATRRPCMQTHGAYVLTGQAYPWWLGLEPGARLYACLPLLHVNAQAYSTMGAIGMRRRARPRRALQREPVLGRRPHLPRERVQLHRRRDRDPAQGRAGPARARPRAARDVRRARRSRSPSAATIEERFGVRVISGFGMSETTFGLIEEPYGERRSGSMGKARQHPDPAVRQRGARRRRERARAAGRRDGRADHPEPGDHARLLRRSRADGRSAPRRLALDGRPRAPRRGRLLLLRRPQEGRRSGAGARTSRRSRWRSC